MGELRMKERNLFLFLVTALTWFTGTKAEYSCQDFTVSNCEDDSDLLIRGFNISSVTKCQQACHISSSCKAFTFLQGHCDLWRDNPRTSCAVVSGPPSLDLELCLVGSITTAGCDGYVEEECEFLGSDTGFSMTPGEIVSAVDCEEYCRLWAELEGCNYWVYNETSQVCHTLDSSQRFCLGLTGPEDPEIEQCRPCHEEQDLFHGVDILDLHPVYTDGSGYYPATWNLNAGEDGTEVWNQENAGLSAVLGDMMYQDVEFTGSFKALNDDDDLVGFIFGFEDDGHFYLVLAPGAWASHVNEHWNDWRLLKLESETGNTGWDVTHAIRYGADNGHAKVVYRPGVKGWYTYKAYTWTVKYQPTLKYLMISVMEDGEELWTKTWQNDFEHELYTGKVGVFQDSQPARFFNM